VLLQTIADIRDDFEPPTMAVQETWRFIPFAGQPSSHPRTTLALRCIALALLLNHGLTHKPP
jgi:hypothetical protein